MYVYTFVCVCNIFISRETHCFFPPVITENFYQATVYLVSNCRRLCFYVRAPETKLQKHDVTSGYCRLMQYHFIAFGLKMCSQNLCATR